MASGKCIYLAQQTLNRQLLGVDYVVPSSMFVALSPSAFTSQAALGTLIQFAAASYATVEITSSSDNWSAPDASASSHTLHDVTFAVPAEGWGTARSYYLLDGDGNPLYGADLISPYPILAGTAVYIPAGDIAIQEI